MGRGWFSERPEPDGYPPADLWWFIPACAGTLLALVVAIVVKAVG